LEEVAQAEWKEMMATLTSIAEHTSASDELAVQIDDLWCDAQQCSVQWGHDRLHLNTSLLQVRELAEVFYTSAAAAAAAYAATTTDPYMC